MRWFWTYFVNLKLRSKLLLSYIVVLVVFLVFWSGSAYFQINNQLVSNARSNFEKHADFTSMLLFNKIERTQRALTLMAEDPSTLSAFSAPYLSEYQQAHALLDKFDPLLGNINRQNEYIDSVIIHTYYGLKGSRSYIRDADMPVNEEVHYINCGAVPQWNFTDDILTVSVKAVNPDNPQNSATVTFYINRDEFFQECLRSQVMDYKFQVFDSNDREIYGQADILSNENNNSEKNDKSFFLEKETELDITGWKVLLQVDARKQMIPAIATVNITLIAILIALLLIIPVMLIFIKSFSSRIYTLKKQVADIVPKQYEVEIRSPFNDEIGDITNTIGTMVNDTRQIILEKYKESIKRRDAQIQALQAQINPHFLYNTLSNLNWRAIANNDLETSRLLNAMSKFYQITLNNGHFVSTLGREFEHVKIYMRIQCAIHKSELAEEIYDTESDLLDYRMPSTILQPLVENAIEHGIKSIEFINGKLHVSAHKENDRIIIRISDNGPGISPEVISEIEKVDDSGIGFGLRNVFKRLDLFFDNNFEMKFEETPGGGTTVILVVTAIE